MNYFQQIFGNSKVRNKVFYTLAILVIFRIGTYIPVPMVNQAALASFSSSANGIFDFINILGGGAFKQFSIFAMSVSPYITASIIVQLLSMDVIPALSAWNKEGVNGKKKLNMTTRVLSLVFAFVQGLAIAIGLNAYTNGQLLTVTNGDFWPFILIATVLTAGTAILVWLGDQITKKGIGNGISMLIMAGIISQLPGQISTIWTTYTTTPIDWLNIVTMVIVYALMFALMILVIYMQEATRKIPIQHANVSSRAIGANAKSNFLPLKVNSAGVVPVIFASALISLPVTIASFFPENTTAIWINENMQLTNWAGFSLYIVLIISFCFFYAFIQVDPEKMAKNLAKQNTFIPAVRPGKATETYLSTVLTRLTFVGALYLAFLAAIPLVIGIVTGLPASVQIGGTSMIIVAGVAIETTKQIERISSSRQYKGYFS
ncbi:MAG: preprotein translocase subunit SecY [Culicoidibacterales bacterium]